MKRIILPLLLVAAVHLHAEPSPVLGRIGDIEITTREFQEIIAGMEAAAGDPAPAARDATAQVVRAVLVQRLVLKQALGQQWDQQPEIIAKLVRARENTLSESYLAAASAPEPGYPDEAGVRDYYETHREGFRIPKSFLLAQIFIASARDADKSAAAAAKSRLDGVVRKLSVRGADFAALARATSEESLSAARGGEIGWLTEEQIQPEIRGRLPKLTLNAVSEPIRLNDGWHILKVLDIRESRIPAIDEVRDNIVTILKAERSRIKRQDFVADLLKKHPLAINEIELAKSRQGTAKRASGTTPNLHPSP